MPEGPDAHRRAELIAALAAVRGRIGDAAAAAGRDAQRLTLIAVTKGFPASDIALLTALGIRDVGESRDQQARAKFAELADLPVGDRPRWHFVGRLQTNKGRSVTRYADVVHSVDRPDLVTALGTGADRAGRVVQAFVQVSLDDDPNRGGVGPAGVAALADAVADHPLLQLCGVMAVVPQHQQPDAAFARLSDVSRLLRADHPDATGISAGMSNDLESAVLHGATHLRVGSALLGRRSPDVG